MLKQLGHLVLVLILCYVFGIVPGLLGYIVMRMIFRGL